MRELRDKVAVVSGAASGIGRALASALAAEGMKVLASDVDAGALAETVASISELYGPAEGLVVDVADAAQVAALADHAYERFGAVHVLCNNAGVFAGGLLWERTEADFEWVLGVNLWGILHGIRAFVPRMIAQDTEGHIVNTCSSAGLFGSPVTGPYTISKFAAFAATECLASDLAITGSKLKVTAVCPGAVDTAIHASARNRPVALASAASQDAEFIETALREATARGVKPEEVAAQVVGAIREEWFLVLSSDAYRDALAPRAESLAAGQLPPLAAFE